MARISIWLANQAHQNASGPMTKVPLRIAPRIARRAFPYGQLFKFIRMNLGLLNEIPLRIASRIARREFHMASESNSSECGGVY
eukprot:8430717-Karenia_brevis.AAC.1